MSLSKGLAGSFHGGSEHASRDTSGHVISEGPWELQGVDDMAVLVGHGCAGVIATWGCWGCWGRARGRARGRSGDGSGVSVATQPTQRSEGGEVDGGCRTGSGGRSGGGGRSGVVSQQVGDVRLDINLGLGPGWGGWGGSSLGTWASEAVGSSGRSQSGALWREIGFTCSL